MQHLIFTKFNMPGFKGDPHIDPNWLDFRISLLKKWLLPSMKQQSCQDFKWIMHCWHEIPTRHTVELMEIEDSYKNLEILWLHDRDWYREWLEKIRDCVQPGLFLTSRVDSDDAVSKHFVRDIQEHVKHVSAGGYYYCFPKGVMHNTVTGQCYCRYYQRNPFLSYLETSYADAPRDIVTVHNRQHCHAEPVLSLVDNAMWLQNVHGNNQGNQYSPGSAPEFDFSEVSKDFIGE